MDREACRLRELVEERRGEIGTEAACSGRLEVGVRDDERPARRLDDHDRESLVRRRKCEAPTGDVVLEEWRECLPERCPRSADLRLGIVGRDLELEAEARGLSELLEEVIEDD